MFLESYCTKLPNNRFSFSKQQASEFAKAAAHDFNPLHDEDNSRFCVPGDLLFSKILLSEGLYKQMHVSFTGMVSADIPLEIRVNESGHKSIYDLEGKLYLDIEHHGACTQDARVINALLQSYVAFSGESFLESFVPLMRNNDVMVHPAKPLVIYDSMTLTMDRLDLQAPTLEVAAPSLELDGKRGKATFRFVYKDQGIEVGRGEKTMVLSGVRPYRVEDMDSMVSEYLKRRQAFLAQSS